MANPIATFLELGLKSLLKEEVEKLPATVKTQSVLNTLKNKGVKPEELKFSGVEDAISNIKVPTVSKEELQNLVEKRKDVMGMQDAGKDYNFVRPRDADINNTYGETVYTFSQGQEGSRFTSTHYSNVRDYSVHARHQRDSFDGIPTRNVYEIQSDLHNLGKATDIKYGDKSNQLGLTGELYDQLADEARNFQSYAKYDPNTVKSVYEKATGKKFASLSAADKIRVQNAFDSIADHMRYADADKLLAFNLTQRELAKLNPPPESPYKSTYFLRTLERELIQAEKEGDSQLAVPLSGPGVDSLKRSEGVQAMYAKQGTAELQKLAKQHGWTYNEVTRTNKNADQYKALASTIQAGVKNNDVNSVIKALSDPSLEANQLASMLKTIVRGTNKLPMKGLEDLVSDLISSDKPVKYGVLNFSSASAKKPSSAGFALYTPAAATMFAAYTALQNGTSPEELKAQFIKQGKSEKDAVELVQQVRNMNKAKQAGYSDADLQRFFNKTEDQLIDVKTK